MPSRLECRLSTCMFPSMELVTMEANMRAEPESVKSYLGSFSDGSLLRLLDGKLCGRLNGHVLPNSVEDAQ
jgi:hypothetical protein